MTKSVHQLIAAAGLGDAITSFTFEVQAILRAAGFQSEIYAPLDSVPTQLRHSRIKPLETLRDVSSPDDILMYHYSTGSPSTSVYANSMSRKWICYHNITPEKYFRPFSPETADRLLEGRKSLKSLTGVTERALGVSEYNRLELADFGFQSTGVLPLVLPTDYLRSKPSASTLAQYKDGKTNLLFVGRVAPNKRLEDIIKTFYYYHHTVNSNSRLILAGSSNGCEPYLSYLKIMAMDADLSESIVFTGQIHLSDLIACYQSASAFLCLSQHEGFCLPLLEAMHFEIPVFALAQAAIPETLGGAGVLLHENNFKKIAELLNEVLGNQNLLKDILAGQRQRLLAFDRTLLAEKLIGMVNAAF